MTSPLRNLSIYMHLLIIVQSRQIAYNSKPPKRFEQPTFTHSQSYFGTAFSVFIAVLYIDHFDTSKHQTVTGLMLVFTFSRS